MQTEEPRIDDGREQIVFGESIDWDDTSGGTVRIGPGGPLDRGIGVGTMRKLLEEGYILPDSSHDLAPTNAEIIDFHEEVIEDEPNIALEVRGYMVAPNRDDSRISFTTVAIGIAEDAETLDVEISRDVADAFRDQFFPADEIHDDRQYMSAWWD